ncbi:MAG: hypothetical protein K1X31_00735 [Gemmatimonadaceae bacterium]|nr:hypothetical protein [Gemmatimonadaceae bacterium]
MTHSTPDLDAFTIPPFSTFDGIEGAYADDDRAVDLWSHYHAIRVNTVLPILRRRAAAFEWQHANVSAKGLTEAAAAIAGHLAATRDEIAAWEAKRDALERARVADSYAPRDWAWA